MYEIAIIGSTDYFNRLSTALVGRFKHIDPARMEIIISRELVYFVEGNCAQFISDIPHEAILFLGSSVIVSDKNVYRYNDWPGCIEQEGLEITGTINDNIKDILAQVGKKAISVPDIDGFISQRIIALIINEAYHTLGDGVSTRKDIDTAMKLGTNYPHGPITWSEVIGLQTIYDLLMGMSRGNEKYVPCDKLKEKVKNLEEKLGNSESALKY